MKDHLALVEKLLAHAKVVSAAEQTAAYALADALLDEYAVVLREQKISAAAADTMRKAGVLERFRSLLSLAESEGKITPAGRKLLALARSAPATPREKFTGKPACKFYSWHRENAPLIAELISEL
jgi:hypothetical protein